MQEVKYCQRCGVVIGDAYNTDWYAYISQKYCKACKKICDRERKAEWARNKRRKVALDLIGGTIQEMLEAELDEHLWYRSYERSDSSNYRNGKKTKKIRGNLGETEIEVPQDRDGTFEPKVVKKRQKDISGIEQKIISLYVKGMTTRQISDTIEEIYGFEVSDGMVSDITDRLLPQVEDWQNRPLDEVYPIVFIDMQ